MRYWKAPMRYRRRRRITSERILASDDTKCTISINDVTGYDCCREDGIGLDLIRVDCWGYQCMRVPESFVSPSPSEALRQNLMTIGEKWSQKDAKASTVMLGSLINEVIGHQEDGNMFFVSVNVENYWEAVNVTYTGTISYMIRTLKSPQNASTTSNFLILHEPEGWGIPYIYRAMCHAGCVLRRRLAAGLVTPVFAVLTDGRSVFQFMVVDVDGRGYLSEACALLYMWSRIDTTLSEILGWLYWFKSCIVTPEGSWDSVREHFGPKGI